MAPCRAVLFFPRRCLWNGPRLALHRALQRLQKIDLPVELERHPVARDLRGAVVLVGSAGHKAVTRQDAVLLHPLPGFRIAGYDRAGALRFSQLGEFARPDDIRMRFVKAAPQFFEFLPVEEGKLTILVRACHGWGWWGGRRRRGCFGRCLIVGAAASCESENGHCAERNCS